MKKFIQVDTLEEAEKRAPWAAAIVEVDGGYMAFEFVTDYQVWRQQL